MKPKVGITRIIQELSEHMEPRWWNDKPAIRMAINDTIDIYSKDGFSVSQRFSQSSAVKKISKALKARV